MKWARWAYRVSLHLLPPALVRKHGPAMLRLFDDNLARARAEGGRRAELRVALGALCDVGRLGMNRRMEGGVVVDELLRNVRYSIRALARAPRFTLAAVLTLALAIGANTAIFSVVDAVLLRPLPFPESDRVVHLGWDRNGRLLSHMPHYKVAFWRERARTLEAVTTYTTVPLALGNGERQEALRALAVDHGFFEATGVVPTLGRTFAADEQLPGAGAVAVLGHRMWSERFGGDPAVLGRTFQTGDETFTVVGVLPEWFRFPYDPGVLDLVIPLGRVPNAQDEAENFPILARLADGASLDEVPADLDRVWQAFQAEHPDIVNGTDGGMRVATFQQLYAADLGRTLWILFAANGFVLLIACANVASLLLARATDRQGDVAVRSAIGASRGRIVREVLTESGLIAVAGAALGLGLAVIGVDVLLAMNPQPLPRGQEVGLDGRVVGFTMLLTAVTGMLFGLPAALPAVRANLAGTLVRGSRGSTRRRAGRDALLAVEAALSMVLLVGAGLLLATLVQLRSMDPGFDAGDVVALSLGSLPQGQGPAAMLDMETAVLARLRDEPSVHAAAWVSSLPLERGWNIPVSPADRPDDVEGAVEWRAITPGYLEALDVGLLRGRDLTDADTEGAERVALVNEAFARRFFPDGALGQYVDIGKYRGRFLDPSFEAPPARIVGVVADQRDISLRTEARRSIYVPRAQASTALLGPGHLVVEATRVREGAEAGADAIAATLPGLAPAQVRPLGQVVAASLARERFYATLMLAFAAVALALTASGIYGVVSYAVRQRRREIGIRMALGANRGRVARRITAQGLRPVLFGLVAGVGIALYLGRFLAHLLWGVSSTDPRNVVAVATVLLAAAALASWLPARDATRTDPVRALSSD